MTSAPTATSTITRTVKATLSRRAPCTGRSLSANHRRAPVAGVQSSRDRADAPRDHSCDHARDRCCGRPGDDLGDRSRHRVARPRRPRGVRRVHAHRLGRARAGPAPAPDHALGRCAARSAGRDVPRRAAGAARGHLQGARQRHRLPLPRRHRAHLPHRQPDQRRRTRPRTTTRRCSTPGRAPRATPTSSSATASTASCGSAGVPRSTSSPPPSASRCATSTGWPTT